jgi:hypothetical protein
VKSRSSSLSRRAVLAAAGLLTLLALSLAAPAAAGSETASSGSPPAPAAYQPGDQVWSDSASVPPPGATIPFVAPDPDVLQVILSPIRPYRPGDKVWTSSDQVPAPAEPDANGCQRVPSRGYIGYHVYASTPYEYSNYWYWSGSSSSEPFHRRLSDDKALYDGSSQGGGGSQSTTSTNWRWQVQNLGSDPQAWNACYETL